MNLVSECFEGEAKVAVLPELPTQDVDVILGNDLAGEKMGSKPLLPSCKPIVWFSIMTLT